MIHKSSTEEVLIKKINLKIWLLQEEIKVVLEQKTSDGTLSRQELEEIQKEYAHPQHAQLKLIRGGKDPNPTPILRNSSLIPPDKLIGGMCILSEIDMQELRFFSHNPFLIGQSVVVEFLIPQKFAVDMEILSCSPFNRESRIIGKNKYPFRIRAIFTFLRPGERALLRKFIQSIATPPKESA